MKELWDAGDFLRRLRKRVFFNELSRAQLQLLRLEVKPDAAALDWLARPADVWARNFPRHIRDRDASLQAVRDAISLRELFFAALPGTEVAQFRAFRQEAREPPRLIITGTVTRDELAVPRLSSPVMTAKLCGFHFQFDDGVLMPLDAGEEGRQLEVTA